MVEAEIQASIEASQKASHADNTKEQYKTWSNKFAQAMEATGVKINQKKWKEGGALPPKRLLKDENLRKFFALCWTQGHQPSSMKSAKSFVSWCLRENRLPVFTKEYVHIYKDSFDYCSRNNLLSMSSSHYS